MDSIYKDLDLFTDPIEKVLEVISATKCFRAVNYFVMVALPKVKDKTEGGILLAQQTLDTALAGNNVGRVLAMGSTVGLEDDVRDCRDLQVGEYVKYNPHIFEMFYLADQKVCIIKDTHISVRDVDITLITDGIFKTYDVGLRG